MPSFSRRTVSTMDGPKVGIWNGTLETSLHRKLVGGGSSFGDGSAIGFTVNNLWKSDGGL